MTIPQHRGPGVDGDDVAMTTTTMMMTSICVDDDYDVSWRRWRDDGDDLQLMWVHLWVRLKESKNQTEK